MANTNPGSPTRSPRSEHDARNTTSPTDTGNTQSDPGSDVVGAPSNAPSASAASSAAAASTDRTAAPPSAGSGIAQKIRDQANARLSSQKDRALDGVGGVTQAMRQTTQSLRDQQHDTVARYVEQAIGQIDRLSQLLREKDVGELMQDAQHLARRQPALFVGSAFAIGLIGARFLKSSPPYSPERDHRYRNRYRDDTSHFASGARTGDFRSGSAGDTFRPGEID